MATAGRYGQQLKELMETTQETEQYLKEVVSEINVKGKVFRPCENDCSDYGE